MLLRPWLPSGSARYSSPRPKARCPIAPSAGSGSCSWSSWRIHELRLWGPWSPIHLLAIFTLGMLPLAVLHARRHRVGRHRNAMIAIFAGALVVAGLFTLMPGRIMHAVVFGH